MASLNRVITVFETKRRKARPALIEESESEDEGDGQVFDDGLGAEGGAGTEAGEEEGGEGGADPPPNDKDNGGNDDGDDDGAAGSGTIVPPINNEEIVEVEEDGEEDENGDPDIADGTLAGVGNTNINKKRRQIPGVIPLKKNRTK